MKVLAIVPARAGSKGLPDKNIAKIGGATLLEWAVRVAKDCPMVSDVYISSDSEAYDCIAVAAGAKSAGLRPQYLASDTAKTVDVVLDLLGRLDECYDYVVLLQPTAPIRHPHDIESMITGIRELQADAAVSIARLEEPHPYKLKIIGEDGFIKPFLEGTSSEVPRQALPAAYMLNGALYVVSTTALREQKTFLPVKTIPYLMNRGVNVDTPEDLMLLETIYEKGKFL
ncbi:acylneuraminate cytidylyltransferase family protein [Mesorhizobium sp. CN2-181]|uniref:acylneuraminate cytidylyltransferase family protein n=1 Tax=Mesorhizobium yinganensis TaxID=3157707 RepID=UPI0032B80EAD